MIPIPSDFLYRVAVRPHGAKAALQAQLIDAIQPALAGTLARFGIDTAERVAYWAGQVCVESDGFSTTVEYASGEAYEGREDLGNMEPGDGRRYKGRGLIQLTGRYNYAAAGVALGLPFLANPSIAAEPGNALVIACWFWRMHNLNRFADADDIESLTRHINGGLSAILERDEATDRAFRSLGVEVAG